MTRKSKQRGHHNPFTYQESRDTLGAYGTQKARIGTDSQLPFGHCALSLTPIVDGVVSPSGTLYERSAAVEYLLKENAKLSEWKEKYEKQCEEDERLKEQAEREEAEGKISTFVGKQSGLNATNVSSHVSKHEAQRLDKLRAEGYDVSTDSEKKDSLKRTSYWLSDWTPDTGKQRVQPPPKRPASPFSGNPLRLKDLKAVDLKRETDVKGAKGTDVVFICAVSGKRLTTQEAVAITKSGTVMLKSNYEEFAKKDMVDPIKGIKFKEKDVVELRKNATGYASSGKVEAEVYTPTIL